MDPLPSRLSTLIRELRRRRVFRAAGAYVAGALLVIEGADLILSPLGLGGGLMPILVIGAIAGFPLLVALAWAYDLTAMGPRRTDGERGEGTDPTADADEPLPALPVRRQAEIFVLFILAALTTVGGTAFLLRSTERRPVDLAAVAVFPFRAIGPAVQTWAEGAPDLLATALDGAEGVRVADPWSLWRPLRPAPDARATPPSPEEAARLAEAAGAGRYLLGSVVDAGDSVTVSLRLYEVGRADPLEVFPVGGLSGDLGDAVRRSAVGVLTRLAAAGDSLAPPDLVLDPTRSPEALKAYLAAREAMRRGWLDSAAQAIDRAVALDSTFGLALVEAIYIKSWVAHLRGEEFRGLLPLLAVAESQVDSVSPRTRLRLEATAASVRTEGARAIAAARRILAMDSTDLRDWSDLSYYLLAYGWQAGAEPEEALAAAERVVRLDSTYVPGLAARGFLALRNRDVADARAQIERLERADTTSPLARGTLAGMRMAVADDSTADAMLPRLVALPRAALPSVIRHLRAVDLDRARRFLQRLESSDDMGVRRMAAGEIVRLDLARGWPGRVDSMARRPEHRGGDNHLSMRAFLVAASLAGVNPEESARRSAAELEAYAPVDSVDAYFTSRPVWLFGWLVGAYNAAFGDTTLARRWAMAFDTMPAGGSPPRWGAALAADIGSRLAARSGQPRLALDRARDAFRLWSIHTDNTSEVMPDPSMRLSLAVRYQEAEMADSARALLSSLVLPTAWFGFLTPRADYELANLALEAGRPEAAREHFERALEVWGDGGPAVAAWRERARWGLPRELAGSR